MSIIWVILGPHVDLYVEFYTQLVQLGTGIICPLQPLFLRSFYLTKPFEFC